MSSNPLQHIPPLTSSTRTSTGPSSHKSHLHLHLHHNRDNDRVSQSAVERLTSPLSDLRQPLKSLTTGLKEGFSNEGSRRGSSATREETAAQKPDFDEKSDGEEKATNKEVTWEHANLVKARKENGEYLQRSLSTLQKTSDTLESALKYSYLDLLSSVPSLRTHLHNLFLLSEQTSALHRDFVLTELPEHVDLADQESARLRRNYVEEAQERIEGMVRRMQASKEKVRDLGSRVGSVRRRVEKWELREMEEQRRTARNFWIFWGSIGALIGLLMLLVVVRHWPGQEGPTEAHKDMVVAKIQKSIIGEESTDMPELGLMIAEGIWENRVRLSKAERSSMEISTRWDEEGDTSIDLRLRIFDEL